MFLSNLRKLRWRLASGTCAAILAAATTAAAVDVAIDPSQGRAPISPYIYGTNQDLPGVLPTARRQGGNRLTGYNWESNASNAGADYNHQSDSYLTSVAGIPAAQANTPAITLTRFHDRSLATGTPYTVLTLQMAGYVAADKSGPVTPAQAAPSSRWVAEAAAKPTAFSLTPDLTDGTVYMDELVNLLVQRYGSAATSTGVRGYDLDNEPDLWASTHPRLHPAKTTAVELVSRSVDLAKAIKHVDPAAETFGFVSYGFNGYYSLQNAPDWTTERAKGSYGWFIDYYLDQLHKASTVAGARLLDVLDLHYYSEAQGGGVRITATTDYTNVDTNKARLQAPRTLWDPGYVENSWIGQYYASYLPLLPRIRSSIASFYPGTKLALTEYNFGGEGHVSGGIAEADALGLFGRHGVYLAALWPLHPDLSYAIAAFKLYLNYDNAGGRFGDTTVSTTVSDPATCPVYAAAESASSTRLHVIALNKSYDAPTTVTFRIAGATAYTSARVFAFDAGSASVTERAPVAAITGNQFSYSLPALTAAHFVLTSAAADPTPAPAKLINISSRAQVGAGAAVFIAGFVVAGNGPKTVLVRAVGPTLTQLDPAGLPAGVVLANPMLQLTTPAGTVIASNDDWAGNAAVAAAAQTVGAFALPANSADAAMLVTLPPGAYTAVVSSAGSTGGVALLEVYEVP